jgi:hypothetical protein
MGSLLFWLGLCQGACFVFVVKLDGQIPQLFHGKGNIKRLACATDRALHPVAHEVYPSVHEQPFSWYSFTHSPTPFVLNLFQLSFPFCAPCRDQAGKSLIVFAHPDSLSKERWQLMLLAEPLVLPVHRTVIPTY